MARKKRNKKQHSETTVQTQIAQMFQEGIQYQQTGQLDQAESIYHNILKIEDNNADALHLIGVIAYQKQDYDTAIEWITKAIAINDRAEGFYNNLGNVFYAQGKFDEAQHCYQQALALNPNFGEAQYNLGVVFEEQGKLEEAISCYQDTLITNPSHISAHYNLGGVFYKQKKITEATIYYQNALAINPKHYESLNNLGNILCKQMKFSEAVSCHQRALAINPDSIETLNSLAVALYKLGKYEEAIHFYRRVLALNPKLVETINSIGGIYYRQGKFAKAIKYYKQALSVDPEHIWAINNLGNVYKGKGLVDESIEYLKKIFEIRPDYAASHSNFLLTLNYSPSYDRASLFKEHQKFNEQHALPLAESIKPHSNERDPDKRLKIGYMSQDFRKHSVAYFIEPILANHDSEQFEIHCYYNHTQNDEVTQRLKKCTNKWVNTVELSDEEIVEQIRKDEIDIMVDLMGHTGMNRILVFAKKPAPIQMTYLGYSNTTGLTTIDYLLTDHYVNPEGSEKFNSETLIRMPNSYFCYGPGDETKNVQVNSLPALQNDYITFASFNVRPKLSPQLLKLWSTILKEIPNSKLLLKSRNYADVVSQTDRYEREKIFEEYFADLDVEFNRVIIEGFSPSMQEHLEMYHKVDIALDSFPYNGATTTCEALWMGVPVVNLVGETHVSLMGLSILSTLGLEELIAYTPEEYVDICINLASDLDYLESIRQEMRERMLASPLMDGQTFTRELEFHYRAMWQKWCDQG